MRKALVVGVNEYQHVPSLHGCVVPDGGNLTDAGPGTDSAGRADSATSRDAAATTDGGSDSRTDATTLLDGGVNTSDGGAAGDLDGASFDANPTLPTVVLTSEACTIAIPTHWTAAVYVATECSINVESSLVIDPGTIVKFGNDDYLTVTDSGTLNAVGTESQPIIFTSIKDDDHGGDSGGDGPTAPSRSDWGCRGTCGDLGIGGNGSVLNHVQLLYGYNGLWVQAGSVQVKNSVFAHQQAYGLALDGRHAVETTILTGNAFFDNKGFPLSLGKAITVDATNIFHDPANPATKNGKQCIELDTSIDQAVSFGVTELGFYGGFTVDSALTVANGVTFKAGIGSQIILASDGSIVNGASAIFISPKDDSAGGDCTGDGATTANNGDWSGLWVVPASGLSDYAAANVADIRYAQNYGTMALH